MEDFGAKLDGGRLVGGEEVVVFFLVDEVLLLMDQVGGKEDVEAEGVEEGVEVGGGGRLEGWESTWDNGICQWVNYWMGWDENGDGVRDWAITMFSRLGGGAEGAGLLEEAAETGATVVG